MKRLPRDEERALTQTRAYFYAQDDMQCPAPFAEKILRTHPRFVLWYARDVLHCRFILGETSTETPRDHRQTMYPKMYDETFPDSVT